MSGLYYFIERENKIVERSHGKEGRKGENRKERQEEEKKES